MKRTIHLFFLALVVSGCSREEPPTNNSTEDVEFSYVFGANGSSTNGERPEPFDVCEIAGPRDTVALARLETGFDTHLDECNIQSEYWRGWGEARLAVLRQDGPHTIPKIVDVVWFFEWTALGLNSETPAGTSIVASLRESKGEWIVTGAAEVQISQNITPSLPVNAEASLPNRWSTLRADAADTRSDYSSRCSAADNREGQKTMTDDEFDVFIRTDDNILTCREPSDAGVDESVDAG